MPTYRGKELTSQQFKLKVENENYLIRMISLHMEEGKRIFGLLKTAPTQAHKRIIRAALKQNNQAAQTYLDELRAS